MLEAAAGRWLETPTAAAGRFSEEEAAVADGESCMGVGTAQVDSIPN